MVKETLLNIKDITELIISLEEVKDQVYFDAIENNFSHELMTPLNPIINSTSLLKRDILSISTKGQVIRENQILEGNNLDVLSKIALDQQTFSLLKNTVNIEQASQNMWYFGTNQITRLKVIKNEVQIRTGVTKPLLEILMKVIWPSEYFVLTRRLNIFFVEVVHEGFSIIADQ